MSRKSAKKRFVFKKKMPPTKDTCSWSTRRRYESRKKRRKKFFFLKQGAVEKTRVISKATGVRNAERNREDLCPLPFIFPIEAQKRIRRKSHSSMMMYYSGTRKSGRKHCQMPVVQSHRQNRRPEPQKHEAAHKNTTKKSKTGEESSAWQPATPGGDQQPHKRPAQGRKPMGRNGPKRLTQMYTRERR